MVQTKNLNDVRSKKKKKKGNSIFEQAHKSKP